jgi:hypothetical protein
MHAFVFVFINIYIIMVKPIVNKILRKKVIESVCLLGLGLKELVFNIKLSEMSINSIEYNIRNNSLTLHVFEKNLDMVYDFNDMCEFDKLIIIKALNKI